MRPCSALSSASSAALADPVGTWLSQDGGTKVHIVECGSKPCGTVVWLDKPNDPRTCRSRQALAPAHRLAGCATTSANRPSGQINNADDGQTYQASLTVPDGNAARVEGCVLAVLCKGQTWTRAN